MAWMNSLTPTHTNIFNDSSPRYPNDLRLHSVLRRYYEFSANVLSLSLSFSNSHMLLFIPFQASRTVFLCDRIHKIYIFNRWYIDNQDVSPSNVHYQMIRWRAVWRIITYYNTLSLKLWDRGCDDTMLNSNVINLYCNIYYIGAITSRW